jgi:hypothetical protein
MEVKVSPSEERPEKHGQIFCFEWDLNPLSAYLDGLMSWESQKERDHLEDQDVGKWTILKYILER